MSTLAPPITDIVATRDGQRLAVAEWPGSGPTMVFAPGLTSHQRAIAGVAAVLDGAVRIVALDLRGRGNSTKPGPGSYGMERHAADVLDVMDALGIDQAIFSGHSMGAYVATAMAVQAPARALGLFLLDGGVLLDWPEGVERPDADTLLELALKPAVERLDAVYPSIEAYVERQQQGPYFVNAWGPIADAYVRYDLRLVPGGYQPKCQRAAAAEDWRDLLDNPRTMTRLDEIPCPVLAVAGEHGLELGQPSILTDAHVDRLRDAAGDVTFVRVSGTTHHTVALSDRGAAATAEAVAKFASTLR